MDNPRVVYMLRMIFDSPYIEIDGRSPSVLTVGIFADERKARTAAKHVLKSPDFEGYEPYIDSWVVGHLYTKEVRE